ncbi:hypothetical protein MKK75_31090 [Methylobacterium sp. J-030]|uniref:hypothetical protein n=1 Tax=Methylobacterium sp. J-030 TaxID=2836627 RepID=UPI001FB8BAF2|nr:hypothetical protein [Methylobacterium sp. J-030]MCJ2073180.1 hypothetical protein [Methylobacterium sp. J-030]
MVDSQDAILDAASVLRARGHAVEADADLELWHVDADWITDEQLLVLAVLAGLRDGPGRAQ